MVRRNSLFFPAKNKRIARIIDITSPSAFRKSIKTLQKGGLSLEEKRALVLARNRAAAQLKRRNLSNKERKQMRAIKNMPLPLVG